MELNQAGQRYVSSTGLQSAGRPGSLSWPEVKARLSHRESTEKQEWLAKYILALQLVTVVYCGMPLVVVRWPAGLPLSPVGHFLPSFVAKPVVRDSLNDNKPGS